jgi:transcriptional regulator with XRE-family HTH domain
MPEKKTKQLKNATDARLLLGDLLRQYRMEAGLTLEQAAELLLFLPSKVSRIEAGLRVASQREVRDFFSIYQIAETAQRTELTRLASASREASWPLLSSIWPADDEESRREDSRTLLLRRILGLILRQYRLSAVLTIDQAAAELLCYPSKISRVETGTRAATQRDVRDFLALYRVDDDKAQEIFGLASALRRARSPKSGQDNWTIYMHCISMSNRVTAYGNRGMPLMLWSRAYAKAIHAELLTQSQAMHQILARPDAPDLLVIIDEQALTMPELKGSQRGKILSIQLEHLLELSRRPNISIRILPRGKEISSSERNIDCVTFCEAPSLNEITGNMVRTLRWLDRNSNPLLESVDAGSDETGIIEDAMSPALSGKMIQELIWRLSS